MTWTYDHDIERTRQALASDNPLTRGLQQRTLEATTSAGQDKQAAIAR